MNDAVTAKSGVTLICSPSSTPRERTAPIWIVLLTFAGSEPVRLRAPLSKHHRPYPTRDGDIAVLPYNASHWRAVFRAAGREA